MKLKTRKQAVLMCHAMCILFRTLCNIILVNVFHCSQIKNKQDFCFADVAEKVLDRCTERKKYVYEFLEDFKPLSLPCCQGRKHDDIESRLQNENDHWGPKHFERSNHPLAIMVSCNDDTSCMLIYHITCGSPG